MASSSMSLPTDADTMEDFQEAQRRQRAEANSESTFFKKIPAELRDRIYEMAIDEDDLLDIDGDKCTITARGAVWADFSDLDANPKQHFRTRLAMTQVCQQFRVENLEMFYSRTTFLIWPFHQGLATKWIKSLAPEALMALSEILVKHVVDKCCAKFLRYNLRDGKIEPVQNSAYCSRCRQSKHTKAEGDALSRVFEAGDFSTSGEKLRKIVELFEKIGS